MVMATDIKRATQSVRSRLPFHREQVLIGESLLTRLEAMDADHPSESDLVVLAKILNKEDEL